MQKIHSKISKIYRFKICLVKEHCLLLLILVILKNLTIQSNQFSKIV